MTRCVSLVQIYACLAFVIVIVATDQDACDKTKCLGPLEYYKLLDCKPVYEKEGDCCAIRYNCDHLKEKFKNKCYVNGKEYQIGESLKDEDKNPCDIECKCIANDGVAAFICAGFDCAFLPPAPGCFMRSIPSQCCGTEEVCPENPEDRATCIVDGKTYKDGEYFKVKNEPDMTCVCRPGYEGKNIEPFCVKSKYPYCSPDFRNAWAISQNCAPIFDNDQPPQTSCSLITRCQNDNDTVIHNHSHDDLKSGEAVDEENVCLLGNLKMHIGDELSRDTHFGSICTKCVCEVPPIPTCQQLSDNECDFSPIF